MHAQCTICQRNGSYLRFWCPIDAPLRLVVIAPDTARTLHNDPPMEQLLEHQHEEQWVHFAARSPWHLDLRVDQWRRALEMRGGKIVKVQRSDDGVTARADVSCIMRGFGHS